MALLVVAALPAASAHAAGVSAVRFTDRCDGSVEVLLPNQYSSGNLIYTVNEELVVVGPGQRPVQSVAAAPTGDLVVHVSVQERDGKEYRTSHDWIEPDSCDAPTGEGQKRHAAAAGDAGGSASVAGDAGGSASVAGDAGGSAYSAAAGGYGADQGGSDGQAYGSAAGAVDSDLGADAVHQDAFGLPARAQQPATGALALTGTNTMLLSAVGVLLVLVGVGLFRRRRRITFVAK
ncbi:LPXTG cell wall anchor domain-containing protein [Dactylosporangium vinaceum]|uniref:LPXTG cell wall anchor domain-containing protein n=1 Tax=Dactylosporangium vinaceum TaxID=53362 RepID=A0ABV5MER3_9ACTN|nr:LPXTG cell wall anchor domain-containing protein [Dactylosporangium vinaceum]UAB97114.1 LPXTG cell wall anchor domain-containing protein [Dactylosporangium vinaceum]